MKRWILVVGAVWLVGFGMGNAFWYLASPLWIDRVVSEQAPAAGSVTALKAGQFSDADAAHKGSGTATLYETADGGQLVSLTDFQVTNGPDLKVYVVEATAIPDADAVTGSRWASLGTLKGNIGDQNYVIPADLGFEIGSVVIWCEQFGVLFSAAPLTN